MEIAIFGGGGNRCSNRLMGYQRPHHYPGFGQPVFRVCWLLDGVFCESLSYLQKGK